MKTASNVELAKSYVPNESSNGATPAGLLVWHSDMDKMLQNSLGNLFH